MPVITTRGIALFFASVFLVVAGLAGIGWPITLVVGSSLLVFMYMAYILARGYEDVVDSLVVERFLSKQNVIEGEEVDVILKITDTLGYGVPRLDVVDHVPRRVRVIGRNYGSLYIERRGTATLSYKVKPCFGTISFNEVELVARDLFGLFGYKKIFNVPRVLRVTPSYTSVKELVVKSTYYTFGVSPSRRKGVGYEFFELRDYQPGDDFRKIVWSAVARTGKLIVREDEAEVQLKTMLFLDLSQDTWVGIECCTGADYVVKTALAVTDLMAKRGDVAGYTLFLGDKWITRPPARAPETLEKLLIDSSIVSMEETSGRDNLAKALYDTVGYLDNGLLVVISSWGFYRRSVVDVLVDVLSRTGCRAVVLTIMPVLEGIRVLEGLWGIEKIYYRMVGGKLLSIGVPLFIARNWSQVAGFLRFLEEVRASSGL